MQPAPLRNDLAEGPQGGSAVWVSAADGVRLRVGGWPAGSGGTVLLFTGRTEYIEKYGRIAGLLAEWDLAWQPSTGAARGWPTGSLVTPTSVM